MAERLLEASATGVARLDARGRSRLRPFLWLGNDGGGQGKELNRTFVGAELEEEFAELAARRIDATERGSLLREISEQFWNSP